MRILLVGGDEDQLKELRWAFWRRHRAWEVHLAMGGEEALQRLALARLDIVMTDLRLPDMAGADLMHQVREREPGAVRIVLSEEALNQGMERAEGDFHRFFLKPVAPGLLVGVAESLDIQDDEVSAREVRALVGGLVRIPSLPTLYVELTALLQRDDAGMAEVARLIRRDLGLAAQVLKAANAVHFAVRRPVAELGQALMTLGLDSLRALVLFRGVLSGSELPRLPGFDLEQLWSHSFQVAMGLRNLAVLEGELRQADLAFSVGLLHDVGLLVLAQDPQGRYRAVLERARAGEASLPILERDSFGVDHTQVGAHLLNLWGLPPEFCRPVREHHAPPAEYEGFPLSAALHVADVLHGGGAAAGVFAEDRWGLHPHVEVDAERMARWRACLGAAELDPEAAGEAES
jgi:HD-like signal output (HDOD) protein